MCYDLNGKSSELFVASGSKGFFLEADYGGD
jgi:hypothetical protein